MAHKAKKNGKPKRQNKATPKSNPLGNVKVSSRKVKGRGGFFEDAGSTVGSFIGKKAGGLLSRVFGLGTYHTRMNTLTNPNNPPILSNTRSATRITHREYITDIISTTGFTNVTYPINAGISTTFPWLAAVAQSFEQYRLHGMIFEFKSTSAVALNSTSTGLGTVILATEYDVTKASFTEKRSMENYMYASSAPPSVSIMHPVECARDVNVLTDMYVRSASIVTNSDLRFSDMGNFQIATVGMPAAGSTIGELWVTYDIELLKPRLPATISSNAPAHYTFDSVKFTSGTAPTSADYFGTTAQKFTLRGVGASPINVQTNTLNFTTTGNYVVVLTMIGSSTAVGTTTVAIQSGTALGTGALVNAFFSSGAGTLAGQQQYPLSTITTNTFTHMFSINVTQASVAAPCQLVYAFGTIPASIIGADLIVATLPSGFTEHKTDSDLLSELMNRLRHSDLDEKWIALSD
jgi:hypothetical protein